MRSFLMFSVILLIVIMVGFTKQSKQITFMGLEFTTTVKGFSILSVVWAHSGARLGVGGIQFIAGVGVALFLICSGYGLEMSYQKNGLKKFFKKRFLRLCIPFWIVQIIGMLFVGNFTMGNVLKAVIFIKANWFIRYIIVCYILFFSCKKIKERFNLSEHTENVIYIISFACWFVLDSLYFADHEMPFLAARQMFSFPLGILLAKNINSVSSLINSKKTLLVFGGGIIGVLFMAITQIPLVKEQPYILSNTLALFTVIPLAVAALILVYNVNCLSNNRSMYILGGISYEIFLIHAFAEKMINSSWLLAVQAFFLTVVFAFGLHMFLNSKIYKK